MCVELGDPRHEELPAAVDHRRARRYVARCANVRNAPVFDDDGLVLQNLVLVHRDHRDTVEYDCALLCVKTCRVRAKQQRQAENHADHPSYSKLSRLAKTYPSARATRGSRVIYRVFTPTSGSAA